VSNVDRFHALFGIAIPSGQDSQRCLETTIDCFVFDGLLFVLRKNDYRRIFDQLEAVRQRARLAAAALHAKVPIANFDAFAEACSTQAAMADKLIAIQGRDYFDRLSYDMLKPVIDEFKLKIPIEPRDGTPHLVFLTEPEQRWRILRLVDDDFLKSSIVRSTRQCDAARSISRLRSCDAQGAEDLFGGGA